MVSGKKGERKKERKRKRKIVRPIRLNLIQVATKTVFDLSRKWRKKSIYYESLEISKAWLKNAYFQLFVSPKWNIIESMRDKYLRDSNILISMLMCQVFHRRSRHCLLSLYPLLLCKPVTNDSTISRIASSNLIRNNTTDNRRRLLNKYQIFSSKVP